MVAVVADSARIAAIYPDDAWIDLEAAAVVEEFRRFIPPGVELLSAATYVPSADQTEALAVSLAENGDIEEAARRLLRYSPSCFAYYCTTVSFIRGPIGERDIVQRINLATGKPATTTSRAMIEAFRELHISRVALASPYLPDVERRFVEFIGAHGIRVVNSLSLSLKQGHSTVPPEDMRALAEATDVPEAEAIFVGCTGQKLASFIDSLEAKHGKAVLTANQVTSWHALRLMEVRPELRGCGRLFLANSR
jgi:maleate isomerase